MKNFAIALCISVFIGTSSLLALPLSQQPILSFCSTQTLLKKVPIEQGELPKAVKKVLLSASYEGWEVTETFRLEFEGYAEMNLYEIHLIKEVDEIIVTFKPNGKIIPANI